MEFLLYRVLIVAGLSIWIVYYVTVAYRLTRANKLSLEFLKKHENSAAERVLRSGLWGANLSDPCTVEVQLACRHNLGLALLRQRKYQDSHDVLDGAAKGYALHRPDSRERPKTLHLQSTALYRLGRYEAAMTAMQQAVNWIDVHPIAWDVAPGYRVDLATAQMRAGRYDAALDLLLGAAAEERRNGKDGASAARLNLGVLYLRRGELPEAEQFLEESLEVRKSVFGARDSRTGLALNNLAWLRFLQGRHPESQTMATEALGIVKGESRSYPLHTLGLLHTLSGHFTEANDLFADAEKSRMAEFADPHPEIEMMRCDLAMLRMEESNLEAAEELLKNSRSVLDEKLPPEHPYLGIVLFRTGQLRLKQGRSQEAKTLLASGLAILERNCLNHPYTIECRSVSETT